jgi:fructose-specific phosphotransferase system IIC component
MSLVNWYMAELASQKLISESTTNHLALAPPKPILVCKQVGCSLPGVLASAERFSVFCENRPILVLISRYENPISLYIYICIGRVKTNQVINFLIFSVIKVNFNHLII